MYGGKSWGRFRHLQPLSTKYNTASTSSRFSNLLRFPARGNNGSMIAHWLSLKSLAYLRRSFFCIISSLYHIFSYWYSFLHTAVLKGTAVFFCSTNFLLFPIDSLFLNNFLYHVAFALCQTLFFYGDIGRTSTLFLPRAPPLQSWLPKTKIGGNIKVSFGKSELNRHPFPDARLSLLSLQEWSRQ